MHLVPLVLLADLSGCWTQSSWSRSGGGGTPEPEGICQRKVEKDPAV